MKLYYIVDIQEVVFIIIYFFLNEYYTTNTNSPLYFQQYFKLLF